MTNKILFTIDTESDLHTGKYNGIIDGLKIFERFCDKYKIKPILFVTADCIKKYPLLFKRFNEQGWEISCHGYSHMRFDEMSKKEKEEELKKCLSIWKRYLGFKPKGFRAPQHSIDGETLDLLEKYCFEYDSSYYPFNFLQLLFFPKKFFQWLKIFFSRTGTYKIRRNLKEIPTSSLFIPFVSLSIRILPIWFLNRYISLIKLIYSKPVFYAHSWDFIELKNSRIDRIFPHTKFIKKLEVIMKNE